MQTTTNKKKAAARIVALIAAAAIAAGLFLTTRPGTEETENASAHAQPDTFEIHLPGEDNAKENEQVKKAILVHEEDMHDGTDGKHGKSGTDGKPGTDGTDGEDGKDGKPGKDVDVDVDTTNLGVDATIEVPEVEVPELETPDVEAPEVALASTPNVGTGANVSLSPTGDAYAGAGADTDDCYAGANVWSDSYGDDAVVYGGCA